MSKVQVSIAVGDYDHVRDLLTGAVQPEGIDLVVAKRHPVEEIFFRFIMHREWDVSEMSFAKYVALASRPDCDIAAIPVFPSRAFRHSSMYVRSDSQLTTPSQLAGARVGIPEWAQTASIYTRGLLSHEYGVPLPAVSWFQAGVNEPGRKEKVALQLPDGVRYTPVADRSLTQMLLDKELDAVFSARPPAAFGPGRSGLRRLFSDPRQEEESFWRRTAIFPIMHVVAIQRRLLERHPWIATNLLQAFEKAKQHSLARLSDITASTVPLPWISGLADTSRSILGDDFWPYGVEANRPTLEAFLKYAHEQGVAGRAMRPEELFVPSTLGSVRV